MLNFYVYFLISTLYEYPIRFDFVFLDSKHKVIYSITYYLLDFHSIFKLSNFGKRTYATSSLKLGS